MKLSIIIVNYNSGAMTASCVESLLRQNLSVQFEIIVVDNASRDESVPFLQSDFPDITVIANEINRGFGAAVNQAMQQAKGEYFLVLNPDIIALPNAVATLIKFMDNNPHAGICGGKLLHPNGKLQESCFRFYTPWTVIARRTFLGSTPDGRRELDRFLMKDFNHNDARTVEWLMGSCIMIRAAAARPQQVGGFDERFFLYFEDVDWSRRFWLKGWKVFYVPGAVFSHFYQQTSRKSPLFGIFTNWTTREHIRSALKYFWKYRGQKAPTEAGV